MKDPPGVQKDSLGSIILLRSVWWWFWPIKKSWWCTAHKRGGSLLGISWWSVAYWENFPPLGKNYLLLSYDSLGIDVDSTLKGVLLTPLGKFYLATLKGAASVSLTHGGVLLWYWNLLGDLVDDLDSRRSFHDDFWSTKGCFQCFRSTRDAFDAFDPLGCFLGSLCSLYTKGISIIFGCLFEFSFAFLASWELHRDIWKNKFH